MKKPFLPKIDLTISISLVLVNLFLIFLVKSAKNEIEILQSSLEESIMRTNDYRSYIKRNMDLFKLPVEKVACQFSNRINSSSNATNFVVLVPSHACNACLNMCFTSLASSNLDARNLYMISENNDQILKRLWIRSGFEKKGIIVDSNKIFELSDISTEIVIIKFIGNFRQYDIFQYEISFDEFMHYFINTSLRSR